MEGKIIKNRLEQIAKNAKPDKDILAVFLFGSFVKNKNFRDVDVCLVLRNKKSLRKAASDINRMHNRCMHAPCERTETWFTE